MSTAPASATEALDMLRAAMSYLATADATAMPAETQARCLAALEQSGAMVTAARASVPGAFTAGQGHIGDGDYSPRMWLVHRTRIAAGAAREHVAWERRRRAHPRVLEALAAGHLLSVSRARAICGWTGKLPAGCQGPADAILVAAAAAGADLQDLAALAAEIAARSQPDGPDDDGQKFGDRAVTVETTFDGAGVMSGDLTPECAAVVTAVLDALSAPDGAEDTRTFAQRYHDGLEEAMRRLVAAGLLPERAGQPVKAVAHVSLADLADLADLAGLDAGSALQREWTGRVRAQWAVRRAAAAASAGGSDGAAWLDSDAAAGLACDAAVITLVTGEVDVGALEDLVRLCVQLAGHGPGHCTPGTGTPAPGTPGTGTPGSGQDSDPGPGDGDSGPGDGGSGAGGRDHDPGPWGSGGARGPAGLGALGSLPSPDGSRAPQHGRHVPAGLTARGREELGQAVIGKAIALLPGPGGLADFLRRNLPGARLGGAGQPLTIGFSETVPAGIRNAVRLRDLHCQWAGGCHQPASQCEVHHIRHTADGGETSTENCILLCHYHHHVMIHRLGWTPARDPDGTTRAWNRDHTKVLRQHSPPARAG